jgi:hypothetical protein
LKLPQNSRSGPGGAAAVAAIAGLDSFVGLTMRVAPAD